MKPANYDLPGMRRALIVKLAEPLDKRSKFYKADYEAICAAVNRKSMKELRAALARWNAIAEVSQAEINTHCQVESLPKC